MFVKKWPLEYQKVIKSYLPTYLWDNGDSTDICDSCDSSDSSIGIDSSDSSDKKCCDWNIVTEILLLNFATKFCD